VAQKTQVILLDDLDGGDADETVTFGVDGVTYEIDLNSGNAAKLRDSLAPYVASGRRVGGRSSGGRGRKRGGDNRTAEIRAWARQNGHKVNERGRIPAGIIAEWEKRH